MVAIRTAPAIVIMRSDKRKDFFSTDHLQADLKRHSVRGGAVTVLSQVLKFVLNTGSTMVLARLLLPQDFGLVAMVTAIVGLVGLFKDLGLSTATVQRRELTHEQVSNLFWINLFVSVGIMILTMALAPLLAWFYDEPRVQGITMVVATGYIFGGLTVQHQALLRRQMRFSALAMVDLCSLVTGIVVGLTSAWLGAGYWALPFMSLASGACNAVGVWWLVPWRPGKMSRASGSRELLAFGGYLTGSSFVSYLSANVDKIVIGRLFGPDSLGQYARAFNLLLLPLQQFTGPIEAVAVPTLSRLTQDPVRYRQAFLRALESIIMVALPTVAWMIGTADWLVLTVLGPQWQIAVQIFMILGFLAFAHPFSATAVWLFTTHGETKRLFHWSLINFLLVIAGLGAGIPWGLTGVATAYAATGVLVRTPILLWVAGRFSPVKTRDFYLTAAPYILAAGIVLGTIWQVRRMFTLQPGWGLLVTLLLSVAVYLACIWCFPRCRQALRELRNMAKMTRKTKEL